MQVETFSTINNISMNESYDKLIAFGLSDISTPKQTANGTVMLYNQSTGDKFGIYVKSGYVRRLFKSTYRPYSTISEWYMYQLNPAITKKTKYGTSSTRITFPGDSDKLYAILLKRFKIS